MLVIPRNNVEDFLNEMDYTATNGRLDFKQVIFVPYLNDLGEVYIKWYRNEGIAVHHMSSLSYDRHFQQLCKNQLYRTKDNLTYSNFNRTLKSFCNCLESIFRELGYDTIQTN